MTPRRGSLIAVLAALLALSLLLPQGTSAAVKCRYNPASRGLSLSATGGSEPELRRAGARIRVGAEFFGPRVNCHGSPTVENTDHISITTRGFADVTIDLSGGPLAPGATREPDSSSEIEITLAGELFLEGGRGADHFRYLNVTGQSGLNLNAGPDDGDVDLFLPNPESEIYVDGGPGPDTIDVVGRSKVDIAVFGGKGNDTLSGGPGGGISGGAVLDGGAGRDEIIGTSRSDLISPGRGADLVRARGGSDKLWMRPDKRRDRIDCGSGRDRVRPDPFGTATLPTELAVPEVLVAFSSRSGKGVIDPFDRLRSCERVAKRR